MPGGEGMCKPEGTGSLSYRRWNTGRGAAVGGLVSTGAREGGLMESATSGNLRRLPGFT